MRNLLIPTKSVFGALLLSLMVCAVLFHGKLPPETNQTMRLG